MHDSIFRSVCMQAEHGIVAMGLLQVVLLLLCIFCSLFISILHSTVFMKVGNENKYIAGFQSFSREENNKIQNYTFTGNFYLMGLVTSLYYLYSYFVVTFCCVCHRTRSNSFTPHT